MDLARGLARIAAAGDDFYLIDNEDKGFYRSNTSAVSSDVLVAQQDPDYWADLSPSNVPLHLFATRQTEIVTIREADGAITQTLAVDREIRSIAYDPAGGVLYGLPQFGAGVELLVIDLVTGVTQVVGDLGIAESTLTVVALVWDPLTSLLFASATSGTLYAIDPITGAAFPTGNMGLFSPFGLAYNPSNGHLYVTDTAKDSLYIVRRGNASHTVLVGGPYGQAKFATGLSFSNVDPMPAAPPWPPARRHAPADEPRIHPPLAIPQPVRSVRPDPQLAPVQR